MKSESTIDRLQIGTLESLHRGHFLCNNENSTSNGQSIPR